MPDTGKVASGSGGSRIVLHHRARVAAVVGLLGLIVLVAFAVSVMRSQTAINGAENAAQSAKAWQAVAPGRVEPASGETKITPVVAGLVSEVLVAVKDEVFAGEPLIRLKDDELRARLAAAEAQVALRERLRNDQHVSGKAADRRKAEDAVVDAESAVFDARSAVDAAALARRTGGSVADFNTARVALSRAEDRLRTRKDALRAAESDSPLPSQADSQFSIARAERAVARAALDNMTIRAPIDGIVLQVNAKVGETAVPSSAQPLLVVGDVSALRVRAEVDDRDVGNIKIGQQVVVRATAFPDRDISGKVASISPTVRPASGAARGPRSPTDVDVVEVLIDLTNPGQLASGMQVDAYFRKNQQP